MTDTIELLEAIGSDASLRYAQVDELKTVLEQTQASIGLTEAVAQGDSAPLCQELKLLRTMQVLTIHAPGHEDDDEDEGEGEDERDPPKQERRQHYKSPSPSSAKPC